MHTRNTRYCNLNLFVLDIIMLWRVVVLLQFILLGIGTLYQDLWEFWTVTRILRQEIFNRSEKGLEFLTLDDILYIFYSFFSIVLIT